MDLRFFLNSILIGVGMAMDAFSVSLANGLREPEMRKPKMLGIASTFGFFQAFMPLFGWICVHTVVEKFQSFEKCIPWVALFLLAFIGGKMLWEGIRPGEGDEAEAVSVGLFSLFVQGIATSIDALSVGFTTADYDFVEALVSSLIIAAVTILISYIGLVIGKKFGTRLSGKASILGGVILIAIGVEIFLEGIL